MLLLLCCWVIPRGHDEVPPMQPALHTAPSWRLLLLLLLTSGCCCCCCGVGVVEARPLCGWLEPCDDHIIIRVAVVVTADHDHVAVCRGGGLAPPPLLLLLC